MSAPEYDDLDPTDIAGLRDGDEVTPRDEFGDEWSAVLRKNPLGSLVAHGYIVRYWDGKPGESVTILSARRPRLPMEPLPDVPCVLIVTVRGVPDVVLNWGGDGFGSTAKAIDGMRGHYAKHITAWRHLTADDLPRLRGEDR